MSKISVELLSSQVANPGYISEEKLTNVTIGCLKTLNRLGKIGEMIEVFKINFISFGEKTISGPVFTVYFRDPMGATGTHGTDFRFIKGKLGEPSADDIADHLYEILSKHLLEHAKKARQRLVEMSALADLYIAGY